MTQNMRLWHLNERAPLIDFDLTNPVIEPKDTADCVKSLSLYTLRFPEHQNLNEDAAQGLGKEWKGLIQEDFMAETTLEKGRGRRSERKKRKMKDWRRSLLIFIRQKEKGLFNG